MVQTSYTLQTLYNKPEKKISLQLPRMIGRFFQDVYMRDHDEKD